MSLLKPLNKDLMKLKMFQKTNKILNISQNIFIIDLTELFLTGFCISKIFKRPESLLKKQICNSFQTFTYLLKQTTYIKNCWKLCQMDLKKQMKNKLIKVLKPHFPGVILTKPSFSKIIVRWNSISEFWNLFSSSKQTNALRPQIMQNNISKSMS